MKTVPIVSGMDLEKYTLNNVYDTCQLCKSKHHTSPIRSAESNISTEVLDLVHCDFQGPIKNPRMSGGRHFLPLLDDVGGLSMVRIMVTKDESSTSLKEMIM